MILPERSLGHCNFNVTSEVISWACHAQKFWRGFSYLKMDSLTLTKKLCCAPAKQVFEQWSRFRIPNIERSLTSGTKSILYALDKFGTTHEFSSVVLTFTVKKRGLQPTITPTKRSIREQILISEMPQKELTKFKRKESLSRSL